MSLNVYTPGRCVIRDKDVLRYLCDPVLAAEQIFKIRLDAFQGSRLKISWWVPRVMDCSGYGSAKTVNMFLTSVLRCALIPDHQAAVYYPSFPLMEQVFYPYFARFAAHSDLFRHQVGRRRVIGLDGEEEEEGKGAVKSKGCYTVDFKNGSRLLMPAGNFLQNSKTQAGLSFNDLYIDEWTKIDATGSEGINEQLIGRARRESFNKDHPLWANHQMFNATAEDAMHQGYDRYQEFLREVKRGNPNYAILQYNFKDWSDLPYRDGKSFKEKLRNDANIEDMRKKGRFRFREEALGIWSDNGKGLYTPELVKSAQRLGDERKLMPITGQHQDPVRDPIGKLSVFYFLGGDPAKADLKKSDDGALVCLRARKLKEEIRDIRDLEIDFPWAYQVRRADAPQWSGLIHKKHLQFGFSGMLLDPNGGGQWIRPELGKSEQEFAGQKFRVRPIACASDEAAFPMNTQFILSMFDWSDERIKKLWKDSPKRHSDNLYDLAHTEFHSAFLGRLIGLPKLWKERSPDEVRDWPEERAWANQLIDKMAKQLTRVYFMTNPDGTTFYSAHQARLYSAKGQKDFAYAAMYAFIALLIWMNNIDEDPRVEGENAALCG